MIRLPVSLRARARSHRWRSRRSHHGFGPMHLQSSASRVGPSPPDVVFPDLPRTCRKNPREPLFEELTENRQYIRLSCLTCLAEQILPEMLRAYQQKLQEATKPPTEDAWVIGAVLGAMGGCTVGAGYHEPFAGAFWGAVLGALLAHSIRQKDWERRRDEIFRTPPPTIEDARTSLRNRPQYAAREVAKFKKTRYRDYLLQAANIADVDSMSGERFEELVASIFVSKGYSVDRTPRTRDYGVDLVVAHGGKRVAVQCKRRPPGERLGPSALQEVYTGKDLYQCSTALVVANAYFSEQAHHMAQKLHIDLRDRDRLLIELGAYRQSSSWPEYLRRYYASP